MQKSRWFFGFVAVAILTLFTGSAAVAQNADPLFCLCIDVNSESDMIGSELACEANALSFSYARSRLRPPKFGEVVLPFESIPEHPFPMNVEFCGEWINGTQACRDGIADLAAGLPRAPHVCTGSPASGFFG